MNFKLTDHQSDQDGVKSIRLNELVDFDMINSIGLGHLREYSDPTLINLIIRTF